MRNCLACGCPVPDDRRSDAVSTIVTQAAQLRMKQTLADKETIAEQFDRISEQDRVIEELREDLRLANECTEWPVETWFDKLCDQHEVMEDQLGMYQACRSQDIVRIRELQQRAEKAEAQAAALREQVEKLQKAYRAAAQTASVKTACSLIDNAFVELEAALGDGGEE